MRRPEQFACAVLLVSIAISAIGAGNGINGLGSAKDVDGLARGKLDVLNGTARYDLRDFNSWEWKQWTIPGLDTKAKPERTVPEIIPPGPVPTPIGPAPRDNVWELCKRLWELGQTNKTCDDMWKCILRGELCVRR